MRNFEIEANEKLNIFPRKMETYMRCGVCIHFHALKMGISISSLMRDCVEYRNIRFLAVSKKLLHHTSILSGNMIILLFKDFLSICFAIFPYSLFLLKSASMGSLYIFFFLVRGSSEGYKTLLRWLSHALILNSLYPV